MWTDKSIKSKEPKEKPYRITEDVKKRGGGRLVLEIKPNGSKYFFFQYFRKVDGKSKRFLVTIGPFKETARSQGYSLSEARDKQTRFENILKQGDDVKTVLEADKSEREAAIKKLESDKRQGTLKQLIESYLAAMEADGKRSHESVKRSLRIYVEEPFPEYLRQNANTIEADDIRLILAKMIDKGVTTHTNRVRSYLHAAFSHGLKQDNNPRTYSKEQLKFNLKFNPVAFVPKQADFERIGEHVIPEEDIKVIWEKLPENSILAAYAVKLAFITGQRLGEIARLSWDDVDLSEHQLIIRSTVSKNKIDHLVPLGNLATETINELNNLTGEYKYLFPATRGSSYVDDKHIYNSTIPKAISEFCAKQKNISKFTARDIRRTVKTFMGKAGINKSIRDKIQNHALQDVSSKHYDRYDYLPEKMNGMLVWNNYLEIIIHSDEKITHIQKARS